MIKEFELIVSGDIQYYRHYVVDIARKLQLQGSAENFNDGTVKIRCKGEEDAIEKFINCIKVKRPPDAPWIECVDNIEKLELEKGSIKDKSFKEIYGKLNEEIFQGFSAYNNFLLYCINDMRKSNDENGKSSKDGSIPETAFNIGSKIEERSKLFDEIFDDIMRRNNERSKLWEERMEKIDKNIESLLNILAQKMMRLQ